METHIAWGQTKKRKTYEKFWSARYIRAAEWDVLVQSDSDLKQNMNEY